MKKIIGWSIFIVAWIGIGYGILEFGIRNVLLPGLSAAIVGFLVLGGIYLIRYAGDKELSK